MKSETVVKNEVLGISKPDKRRINPDTKYSYKAQHKHGRTYIISRKNLTALPSRQADRPTDRRADGCSKAVQSTHISQHKPKRSTNLSHRSPSVYSPVMSPHDVSSSALGLCSPSCWLYARRLLFRPPPTSALHAFEDRQAGRQAADSAHLHKAGMNQPHSDNR